MKHPEPVHFPISQPAAIAWVALGLWLGVAVLCVAYAVMVAINPAGQWWRAALVALAALGVGWALLHHHRGALHGHLRFDGLQWWVTPQAPGGHAFTEQPVALALVWDLQTLLWVRFRWDMTPDHRSNPYRYIWLQSQGQPGDWLALRRAIIYSSNRSPQASTLSDKPRLSTDP